MSLLNTHFYACSISAIIRLLIKINKFLPKRLYQLTLLPVVYELKASPSLQVSARVPLTTTNWQLGDVTFSELDFATHYVHDGGQLSKLSGSHYITLSNTCLLELF